MLPVPPLLAGHYTGLGTRFQRHTPVNPCPPGGPLVVIIDIAGIAEDGPVIFS